MADRSQNPLEIPAIASPATPASGYGKIYPKPDGEFYGKNDAGVEKLLSGVETVGTPAPINVAIAAGDNVGVALDKLQGQINALRDETLLEKALAIVRSGTNGAIYNTSDLGSLWSNTARTAAATLNNKVAVLDDLSGNGFHASQSDAAKQAYLRGTPTGPNICTDPGFNNNAAWTKGTGWTVTGGVAVGTATSDLIYDAAAPSVIGQIYKLTYTITVTSGFMFPFAGAAALGTARTVSGTYVDYITAVNTSVMGFYGNAFTGSIDNFFVEKVDAANVTAPYFLDSNGAVGYQTAAMNMSAVDKVFVIAGYGQQSTASEGVILETSATADSNAGAFRVSQRAGVAHDWGWSVRGNTSISGFRDAGSALPRKNVIAVQFDLAGASRALEVLPRVDGLIPTLTGTGTSDNDTGNLGNHALNIFSRNNGASAFGFGEFYGAAIVPRSTVLSDDDVLTMEEWQASIMPRLKAFAIGDSTVAAFGAGKAVLTFVNTDYEKVTLAAAGHNIAAQKAVWQATQDRARAAWVVIQVGLNDMDPAEAAAPAIARLQDLVDTVNADVGPLSKVYVSKITPERGLLISFYGPTDGETAYQKWLAFNAAIAGSGGTPITGADGRITAHEPILNDGTGALKAEYDSGGGIHPNNLGRMVVADAWNTAVDSSFITKIETLTGSVEVYDMDDEPTSPTFPYIRFERDGAGDVQAIYLGTAT